MYDDSQKKLLCFWINVCLITGRSPSSGLPPLTARLFKAQDLASPRLDPSFPNSSAAQSILAPQRLPWWAAPVKSLPREMSRVMLLLAWLVAAAAGDAFVFIPFLLYLYFLLFLVCKQA